MTSTTTRPVPASQLSAAPASGLRRALGVIGLLGIAVVHLLDLPGKIDETPYIAVLYVGVIVAALVLAGFLVKRDDRPAWASAGGLALLVALGYVVNRTVGLPSATDDIGNWGEPLGVVSLVLEALVAVLAAVSVAVRRTASSPRY